MVRMQLILMREWDGQLGFLGLDQMFGGFL